MEELENPEEAAPPVELHVPYMDAGAGTSTSSGSSASAAVGQARVQAPSSASYHHGPGMGQALSLGPPSGVYIVTLSVQVMS